MRTTPTTLRTIALSIAVSFLCGVSWADDWDGTWRLAKRELPDGTVLTPPAVYGLNIIKDGTNQLLVYWLTPAGKPASLSQVFSFSVAGSEMSAVPVMSVLDDGSGKPPVYNVGGPTKRVSISRDGGRISYQHPLNPPFIVRDGDSSVATFEGVFIDYWERQR